MREVDETYSMGPKKGKGKKKSGGGDKLDEKKVRDKTPPIVSYKYSLDYAA